MMIVVFCVALPTSITGIHAILGNYDLTKKKLSVA